MKYSHQIKVSVFSKIDDEEKIKKTLINLFPFDLADEKVLLKQRTAKGFEEKKIRLFEIVIDKKRHTKKFLENLFENLDGSQKEMLLRQKKSRLDKNLNFYLRLDKEKLLHDKWFVADSGDCFHIKISIAAFPSNYDSALKIVEEFLKTKPLKTAGF